MSRAFPPQYQVACGQSKKDLTAALFAEQLLNELVCFLDYIDHERLHLLIMESRELAPGDFPKWRRYRYIDMLAAKVGIDPVEFRLKNLTDERMRRVLQAAAGKFGWSSAKAPSKRGYGVACGSDAGTYVAHMAEVAVDQNTGRVGVKRVVCAQEMGLCVNPEGARLQMEGGITMGLGYALSEEVRFKGGEILHSNFDTYTIPHFSWLPEIETVVLDAKDSPCQGGGEPPIICMGGLIANAVFDATGARLLQLPMTPERIKNALSRL